MTAPAAPQRPTPQPQRPTSQPRRHAPAPIPATQPQRHAPAPIPAPQPQRPAPQPRRQTPAPIAAPLPQLPARAMDKNVSTVVPETVANRAHANVQAAPKALARKDSAESDSGRSVSRSMSVEPSPRGALKPSPPHSFVLGQVVECKTTKDGKVYQGVVQNIQPLMVNVQGFKVGRWRYVRAKDMVIEVVLIQDENIFANPDPNTLSSMK